MTLQYLSNQEGQIIAVQVPIDEWELIKNHYPEVESFHFDLPEWQKELIDKRLDSIKTNPERILPIETLMAELDRTL